MTETARAVFANDLSELRRLSEWFRGLAASYGMPEGRALDLELCLNEIVANVIQYAYDPGQNGREIRVTVERDGGSVRLVVEDDGRPFDPLAAPALRTPRSLEDLPVGGWGIPLVRTLLDDVRYERRDGANRLTLVSTGAKGRTGDGA